MVYSIIGLCLLLALFFFMVFFITLGYRLGAKKVNEKQLSITEGAVFTLMALLVAFTFSSANQRFDQRRVMIIDEANAISTAYLRLDLLPQEARKMLREDFIAYISSRLTIYQFFQDKQIVAEKLNDFEKIEDKLWQDAIAACKQEGPQQIAMLLLPAINAMFDIASTRIAYTSLHLHPAIFFLLILVAFLSAFLTGYSACEKKDWFSLHVIAYAMITSLTIYIILDIEMPRYGVINISDFDRLLITLKNQMLQSKF